MNIAEILQKFEAKKAGSQYKAKCPAHADNTPSLSIAEGKDGKVLIKCHAGCDTQSVLDAAGLTTADLFNGSKPKWQKGRKGQIVATYDYQDEDGKLLFQVLRYDPKDFKQRRPDGKGEWIWRLEDVRRVLYRLPELIASDPSEPVFFVEGEKDADRLAGLGLTVTTSPQGAGKWRDEFGDFLTGRDVVVLPDNDGPGRKHVEKVAQSLSGRARRVRILDLPNLPEKGDVSDWLNAGGTVEALRELVNKLPDWLPNKAENHRPKSQNTNIDSIEFVVRDDGVFANEGDGPKRISSKVEVEADTRDEFSENWGRLLKFEDRAGVEHRWAMPMNLLAGDGREYRQHLLDLGVTLVPGAGKRRLFELYLNKNPEKTVLCVTKQGWHQGCFVLPDESIGGDGQEIYLQNQNINQLFRQSGTAAEWRERIGRYCARNNRLILAASIAFSAPLLDPLQGESGGWHFTGTSSIGKSTTLYVAGSVHGGGSDRGFLRRWRATINGLETVAEAHHDSLLCLDELVECKPDDVSEAAYMLSNGQGKIRQSRGGSLRRTLEWRLVFLSSGEITIADHVAQTGRRTRAGQDVRVINLPADAGKGRGLFDDLHEFNSGDEFARYLQRSACDTYGTPIREFIRRITGLLPDLPKKYRTFEDELLCEMLPKDASSEVLRVAHRFALVAFAGEIATEAGLTGWEPDDATSAAKCMFGVWLADRGTHGSADEHNALRQVRTFIEQHGSSRFQRLHTQRDSYSQDDQVISDDRAVINRAGFVEPSENGEIKFYCILPETFRSEVCRGFDWRQVTKIIENKGFLKRGREHLTAQIRTPEGVLRVYKISSKILDITNSGGDSGDSGDSLENKELTVSPLPM